MAWVAGVDGCRRGWVVALTPAGDGGREEMRIVVCRRFDEVLALPETPEVIAADIPIGLLDDPVAGGRHCDRHARQLMKGTSRVSSVFSPPIRWMLSATAYDEVRPGLSRQAFGILPKIREVDEAITPDLQQWVYEVHPEVCFYGMAGEPLAYNKKSEKGQQNRLYWLAVNLGEEVVGMVDAIKQVMKDYRRAEVGYDDVLDACAAAWSARRIVAGKAERSPECERDSQGLEMAIHW